MTKNDTSEELEFLHDWCRIIVDHVKSVSTEPELLDPYDQMLEDTRRRANLKGLRTMAKDCGEWARGLTSSQQSEIDVNLRARFGKGLAEPSAEENGLVERVKQRGRMDSAGEYETLLGRVEALYEDERMSDEVARLNDLLAKYHRR